MNNRYGVSKKQWKKWPEISQRMFNTTYEAFLLNQSLVTHPDTKKLPQEQWNTIAWNAAWLSADHVLENLEEMAEA